jgi:hypothetical protein
MILIFKRLISSLLVLVILGGGCSPCSKNERAKELQYLLDSLTGDELRTLEEFLFTMFSESQGGYVLYGNKPICIEAFPIREEGSIFLAKWMHVLSLKLKKGAILWKKLNLNKYSHSYILFAYEKPVFGKWVDVVLINKKEALKVIEANLPLFQYVLGPKVTPDTLLAKLTDSNETFQSVLRDDQVLIGILLGYGTQNSLLVSREENIRETVSIPTFGFSSIHEEASWLNQGALISIDLSEEKSPLLPWFGCYDTQETKLLIHGYRQAQKRISKMLQSKRFLETVLGRFFDLRITLNTVSTQPSTATFPKKSALAKIVATSIWNCIDPSLRDPEYIHSFYEGLYAGEEGALPLADEQYDDLAAKFIRKLGENTYSDPAFSVLRKELGYYAGIKVWNHFKLGNDLYDFSEVMELLPKIESGSPILPIDSSMDEVLTDLHRLLYIREESKQRVGEGCLKKG